MRIFTITHEYSMEMIKYVAAENKEIQHLKKMTNDRIITFQDSEHTTAEGNANEEGGEIMEGEMLKRNKMNVGEEIIEE
jgi:hypothetical protein